MEINLIENKLDNRVHIVLLNQNTEFFRDFWPSSHTEG